jgi:hypothetical protein
LYRGFAPPGVVPLVVFIGLSPIVPTKTMLSLFSLSSLSHLSLYIYKPTIIKCGAEQIIIANNRLLNNASNNI